MKSAIVAGLLTSVLYSQQAVATYGWNDAQSFSNPDNSNNVCSGEQSGGYNWGGVPTGPIGNFDGFAFSGFDCQDSFNVRNGKRGLVRRTKFTGKAIVGRATTDDASCPKIKGQDKDFSIREMHVSVDKDSDLTFEYDMPDGSTCRQKNRCSIDGTTVKNTQCGGAKQVKVKGDCGFGFHNIIFDCQPGTSSSSSSTTTPVSTPTGGTTTTTTTTCAETESKDDKGSCVPKTTPVTTTPATTTTPPVTTTTPPATTTTTACAETESKDDKGSCVPKTTPVTTTPATTTTTACAETESKNDKGSCVPKSTPVTTTSVPTPPVTTTACAETESKNDKGSCVPKTTPVTTTPATTPATTTSACKESETLDKGSCVPKTPTGGVTTPTPCATSETSIEGKCVPLTTDVKPSAPTCGPQETFSGTGCVPKTPTGGVTTTPPASSDLVTTEIVITTLTTCPVTITSGSITSVTTTLSTTTITSTATFCPKCGEAPPTTIGSTTVDAPPAPTPPTCKGDEELKDGKCVPKVPTGGVTSPATSTPAATTSCKETESFEKGSCVPKTPTGGSTTPVPVVTPPTCKENEEQKDGICVPKPPTGGSTTPVPTTTPVPCKEGEEQKDGKCVPKPPTGGSTTPVPTTTPVPCKEGEEQKDGKCVPKPPTGGSTTPVPTTTPAPCKEGEEQKDGQCVPKPPTGGSTTPVPSTTPAPPTCKDNEEIKDGKCVPKTPTGGVTSPSTTVDATPPETPVPEAPCPSVLPRCLSTWMQKAGSCSSNSDIKCYCPSPDFISTVQECVSAWSGNDEEVQGALSFLVGICAEFVPQNPGICTGVPSTITLIPTPSAPAPTNPAPSGEVAPTGGNNGPRPTPPPFAGNMPSTVITFTRTLTAGSTTTQFVTVPQVVFNTVTQQVTVPGNNGEPPRTQGQGVGLVPALPLTTPPATPTAASTPVAGQTGASTFIPSSTTAVNVPGASGSKTGENNPVKTFTGSASKAGYGVAAGVFGLIAFLV